LSKLDEPLFIKVIIGSAISLALIIIGFILDWFCIATAPSGMGKILAIIFTMMQNILLIVLCVAILVLSAVGKSVYYKNENIPFIFGLITSIASGVILGFNVYFVISTILSIIFGIKIFILGILIFIFEIAIIGLMVMSLVYSIKVAKTDTY
jgi:hypothetical protein